MDMAMVQRDEMDRNRAPVGNGGGLRSLCEQLAPRVAELLPRGLTPERLLRTALLAASRNPDLYRCTRESVARSILGAAELGLDCSGTSGAAYLVPYGREAVLVVGYQGLVDLVLRAGRVRSIEARLVHDADEFALDYGAAQPLRHRPELCESERGPVTHVYAVAWFAGHDRPQVEVMTRGEIEAIRRRSRSGDSGPWRTDWGEMAKKTVVRRLCKLLPQSTDVARAFQIEEETRGGRGGLVGAATPAAANPAEILREVGGGVEVARVGGEQPESQTDVAQGEVQKRETDNEIEQ